MSAPLQKAPWLRRTVVLGLVLGLTLALAAHNRTLRQMRAELLPDITAHTPEAPAWVNLVEVSLGGFRGLAATLLWVRAAILQEEGRFVELVALADWITRLDPHAAEAWSYHAWNLAYNVSAMLPRHEDRLRWVDAGIALLRDRGLRLNPRSAHLYRELGWLYQHKLGASGDAAHLSYKRALAQRLAPLLEPDGAAPPPGEPRAAALLDAHRLEAERMQRLEARFGPLDWRLPESHAIYWATAGLRHPDPREDLLLHRMVYQCLGTMLREGRLIAAPDAATDALPLTRAPNPELIPGTLAFFAQTLERFPIPTIRDPYARYLVQAMRLLVESEREADARALFAQLTALLGDAAPASFDAVFEWLPDPDL